MTPHKSKTLYRDAARETLALIPFLRQSLIQLVQLDPSDELTLAQSGVLRYLRNKPMTLSELARARQVSVQSAGELVQALVERGWVERVRDVSDRRQWRLQVTEAGEARHDLVVARMVEQIAPALEGLTESEVEALHITLQALRRVFSE